MSLEIRVANLEAAFRRLQPQQTATTITTATGATERIHFLNSIVSIESAQTGTVSWTTYNASAYIPKGYRTAILQIKWAMSSPDTGDIIADVKLRERSGTIEIGGAYGRASGTGDEVGSLAQVLVPTTSERTFDYTIEAPGFDLGVTIELIGYWY